MFKDARIPVIEILECAAEKGLPQELVAGENVPDVMLYHDLIDQGYLMGTILSDGKRPYFIESCHITSKGREYLVRLKREIQQKPERPTWWIRPWCLGFLAGCLLGLLGMAWWISRYGMPSWAPVLFPS